MNHTGSILVNVVDTSCLWNNENKDSGLAMFTTLAMLVTFAAQPLRMLFSRATELCHGMSSSLAWQGD